MFEFKSLTTERIRYLAVRNGAFDVFDSQPLSPSERKRRDDLLRAGSAHFFVHYHDAVEAIRRIFHYDLETEMPLS
jgi:hypothetical protein